MSQTSNPSATSMYNNTRSSSIPKSNQNESIQVLKTVFLPPPAPPVSHLTPSLPFHPFSVQMWSRWPSTGSPETSTLWMTWTTGSLCVTRMGRHVSLSWTRSCIILKALPWTPPWGQFDILLSVLCVNTHHANS